MKAIISKLSAERPDILTERIIYCSNTSNTCKFAKQISYREAATINIFEVNATDTRTFAEKTWLEILTLDNERMRSALFHVLNNKDYYTKPTKKALSYRRIGENVISVSCPYRTAIGKA